MPSSKYHLMEPYRYQDNSLASNDLPPSLSFRDQVNQQVLETWFQSASCKERVAGLPGTPALFNRWLRSRESLCKEALCKLAQCLVPQVVQGLMHLCQVFPCPVPRFKDNHTQVHRSNDLHKARFPQPNGNMAPPSKLPDRPR